MRELFSGEDLAWIDRRVPAWKRAVKRGIDIAGSAAALLLFSPIILLIALAIKADSRGTVFFVQERVGWMGKPFNVVKFRTMVANAAELGGFDTGESDPRITKVGKFLRGWTLDELPQFWNVLKGEMSLVGPRPTLAYQVEKYTSVQRRRLLVKPGMSGLAQVSGRNKLSWPERIELDVRYIEEFSLGRDFKILLRTFGLIFSREGIYGDSTI